ncbi:hypothetical protein BC828DRAFT_401570, partial [Blastocladiella britannica]
SCFSHAEPHYHKTATTTTYKELYALARKGIKPVEDLDLNGHRVTKTTYIYYCHVCNKPLSERNTIDHQVRITHVANVAANKSMVDGMANDFRRAVRAKVRQRARKTAAARRQLQEPPMVASTSTAVIDSMDVDPTDSGNWIDEGITNNDQVDDDNDGNNSESDNNYGSDYDLISGDEEEDVSHLQDMEHDTEAGDYFKQKPNQMQLINDNDTTDDGSNGKQKHGA